MRDQGHALGAQVMALLRFSLSDGDPGDASLDHIMEAYAQPLPKGDEHSVRRQPSTLISLRTALLLTGFLCMSSGSRGIGGRVWGGAGVAERWATTRWGGKVRSRKDSSRSGVSR